MKNSIHPNSASPNVSKLCWFTFLTSFILILTACSSNSISLNNPSPVASPTALSPTTHINSTPPATSTPNHLIPTATALPETDTAVTTALGTPIDLNAPSEVEWADGVQAYLSLTEDYWQAEWEDNSLIRFDFTWAGEASIEVAHQKFYQPTPLPSRTPDPPSSLDYFSYSPDKKFFIECTAFETILFRVPDQQWLGQAPVRTRECYRNIAWTENSARTGWIL